MEPVPWHKILIKLTEAIEPHTITALQQIKEQLLSSGHELDSQVKQHILSSITDWLTRLIDRIQFSSLNENCENLTTNDREVNSEKLENECTAASNVNCEESKRTDGANNEVSIEMVQATEGQAVKYLENILQSIAEEPVEKQSAAQAAVIFKTSDSSQPSLLLEPSVLQEQSTIPTPQDDSTNAIDEQIHENIPTNLSDEVPIVENNTVIANHMTDLLMNLNLASKSQVDGSPLKRRSSSDWHDEPVAKKSKEVDADDHIFPSSHLFYECVNCVEASELMGSVDEVYQHWRLVHLAEQRPFQYQVMAKMRCMYCDFTARFTDVSKHHQEQHSSEPFAVVNMSDSSTCGICASTKLQKSELIDHFNKEHESILQHEISNPISLNDNVLSKLLPKNSTRYQCAICDRVFETQTEMEFHHTIEHAGLEIALRAFDCIPEPYLICDYCQQKLIERDKYLNHIEEHCYMFKCSKCEYQSDKLIDLIEHDKQQHRSNSLNFHCNQFCELLKKHFANTKVIFENGLVLFNHQLTNTKFGSGQILFDIFIDELMAIIQQKHEMEYGTKDEINTVNRDVEVMAKEAVTEGTTIVPSIQKPNRPPVSARAMNAKELRSQNRLINNLCIYGIPYFENENKNAIFLNMCSMLQANVNKRDISRISRAPGRNALLIVELKSFEVKQRILQCAYMQQLWSSDLIQLPNGMPKTRVFNNIHTTKFYGRMAKIARNAMKNQKLFIFWITKFGFLVKRTKNSPDKIVLSPNELIDYINQREQSNINREKQFYRNIAWVPKSNDG